MDEQLENTYMGKNCHDIRNKTFSIDLLLFGVLHAFYKRVYSWGLLWLGIIILSYFIPVFSHIHSPYYNFPLRYFSLILLIAHISIAFIGRKIYLSYVEKKVQKIKEENPGKSFEELKNICQEKGSNSFLSFIICLFVLVIAYASAIALQELLLHGLL